MKIALDVSAVPAEPVGAGVYTLELAIGLAQRSEVELHLIARKGDARWQEVAPSATTHRIVADDRPRRILWEATRAARVARSIGCDVWHGPHYTLPRDLACASIVTVHDLTFFDQPETHERIKVAFFRRAITRNASNASGVICVSATTANRLRAIVADAAPITVAHHGVDHNRFSVGTKLSDDTDQPLLERRGIHAPFLAFVGTVQPRKGLPTLVEAFAQLRTRHPELRLVIAGGDGWGTQALRDAIQQHAVVTSVVRTGYIDDATVAALYRQASVVVYPSLAEGFGLPVLEAMACGAPVVTSSGTAMDEFIDDGGIAVPPGNPQLLADAIQQAMNPINAVALRERGPQIAARYTWSACIDTHLVAYRAAQQHYLHHSRTTH